MENASKAILIAGSVLIGVLTFVIFIYEISYITSVSELSRDNITLQAIAEFNSKFEIYANRDESAGYLGKKNAIAIQEFVSICSMVQDWNLSNVHDKIEINIIGKDEKKINKNVTLYLNSKMNTEWLISVLKDYYFIFTMDNRRN